MFELWYFFLTHLKGSADIIELMRRLVKTRQFKSPHFNLMMHQYLLEMELSSSTCNSISAEYLRVMFNRCKVRSFDTFSVIFPSVIYNLDSQFFRNTAQLFDQWNLFSSHFLIWKELSALNSFQIRKCLWNSNFEFTF